MAAIEGLFVPKAPPTFVAPVAVTQAGGGASGLNPLCARIR